MARFFVPPLPDGAPAAERAYRELRDQAEASTGAVSRDRRIEGVLYRCSGRDCQLRVGELDVGNGRMVVAIIQVGRDAYTVHHLAGDATRPSEPVVLHGSDIYSVTDFQ
ncbi:MAG TPA: hypothetical protein VNV44_07845 [Solirubrobacteraceae bacterium]|jgi:hypothetical protein|nr:hypothetical protein [Solirubrobacteraceae bacterium]